MDNLALVIIAILLIGLGLETGWSMCAWRKSSIIRKKDQEIAGLKEAIKTLEERLMEEIGRNVRTPIQGRRDLLERIPRFSDSDQGSKPQ